MKDKYGMDEHDRMPSITTWQVILVIAVVILAKWQLAYIIAMIDRLL